MARSINKLTARSVASVKQAGLRSDGNNLYLSTTASGAQSWRLIYKFDGKRREMGLGSSPTVSLASAREKAKVARLQLSDGLDPLAERSQSNSLTTAPSFGCVASDLIASLEPGWENNKHGKQWAATLTTYAANIWNKPVDAVTTDDVLAVLNPIWSVIPETASRVRGRIERVLSAAKARGLRRGENPAGWKGHLAILLPPRPKQSLQRHHAAMPFKSAGAFVAMLRSQKGIMTARALEFTILTAARTSETLHATWSEIDRGNALWIVPAKRMKGRIEHRVPLSNAALAVLDRVSKHSGLSGAYIFEGPRPGQPLSNMSMNMLLRRMKIDDITVHGFRSTFRDWVGEVTQFPREIAEAALAHRIGNEVERAYSRGDALEKRRPMMTAWAAFLDKS